MKTRPPIITILGHVDHGKTTLLDNIRKTNIAEKESGGITQSIGAYEIEHDETQMTFIDTPGHEAFSAMRARGAEAADIAVLVVAADDGVQPQTKEALEYIKNVDIPYIVAINKIDLPGADIEKTLNDLAEHEVYLEGRGGDVSYQKISALKGEGVDELLDLIGLAADIEELEYDPDASGEGVVLNSFNDPGRGIAVGVVITNGSLKKGDEIFTSSTEGKIKLMEDVFGNPKDNLEPSSPALILGFKDAPKVGELFKVGEKPKEDKKESGTERKLKTKKEDHLGVLLKADEVGTLEALEGVVKNLETEDVPITIVKSGVGNITEGDVKMAFSTDSLIIGFNVKADKQTKNLAKAQKIKIFTSSVIYDLQKDLKELVDNMSEGRNRIVKILEVFGKSKGKQVIGGKVVRGHVLDKERFNVIYKKEIVGSGKIVNLQSQKENVNKAEEGQEVGILVEADTEIQKGSFLLFSTS